MYKLSTSHAVQILSSAKISPDPLEWTVVGDGPGVFHFEDDIYCGFRARLFSNLEIKSLMAEIADIQNFILVNLSENRNITEKSIENLAVARYIRVINLSSCDMTDFGLEDLAKFPYLEYIDLSYCNRITERGLFHLKKCRNLKLIDLRGCSRLTHRSVDQLARPGLITRF